MATSAGRVAIAAAVFWMAFEHGTYGTTQVTTVGLVLWWMLVLVAISGTARTFRLGRAAWVSATALTAFAILELASLEWSHDATDAVATSVRTTAYVGIFVAACLVVQRLGHDVVIDGIACGTAAVAIISLANRLFGLGGRLSADFKALAGLRLSYPLDYWNGLAIFVALGIPLLLHRASRPGPGWARGLSAAPLPVIWGVIYLTSSRGGVIVAAVGIVALLLATPWRWRTAAAVLVMGLTAGIGVLVLERSPELSSGPLGTPLEHWQAHRAATVYACLIVLAAAGQMLAARLEPSVPRSRVRVGWTLSAAVGLVALVGVVAVHPVEKARAFARKPPTYSQQDFVHQHLVTANGSGRWQQWTSAVDEWRHHPFLGGGAGTFHRWWLQHGTLPLHIQNAHSLYLETLGETGVVGFLLLVAALGAGVGTVVVRGARASPAERHRFAAIGAAFLAFLVGAAIDWVWQLAAVAGVGVTLLAAIVAPVSGEPPLRRSVGAPTAIVLVGAAATAALALVFIEQGRLAASHHAAGRGDLGAATGAALAAERIAPWSTEPRLELALIAEERGRLRTALHEVNGALARDRGDWSLWLVRARLETKLGSLAAARASLHRAAELDPGSKLFATLPEARKYGK